MDSIPCSLCCSGPKPKVSSLRPERLRYGGFCIVINALSAASANLQRRNPAACFLAPGQHVHVLLVQVIHRLHIYDRLDDKYVSM